MKLTAGKLRLAGWLIIAQVVVFCTTMTLFFSLGLGDDLPTGKTAFLSKPAKPIMAWILGLLFLAAQVYVLLAFKALLEQSLNYLRANKLIVLIVIFTIVINVCENLMLLFTTNLPLRMVQLAFTISSLIIFMWLWIRIMDMPNDLFGYKTHVGKSGFLLSVIGIAFSLLLPVTIFVENLAMPILILHLVMVSALLVLGFYFICVFVQMFFKAARAVEQAQQAPAMA